MSMAAQAVRPKTAAPAPEVRRSQRPQHGAMLSGSPRYLRANLRLGGMHDREEHEADHAASVIAAGGCHRVHDPGGAHHLRATGTAVTTRPSPATADGEITGKGAYVAQYLKQLGIRPFTFGWQAAWLMP